MAGVKRLRFPPVHGTLNVDGEHMLKPRSMLSDAFALSYADAGEGFTPSPVLTGEGRDEGELKRIRRSINNRLHREMLVISRQSLTIGAPADSSLAVMHPAARPSPGTSCHPLPRRRGRGFQRHTHGGASCRHTEFDDPATSWPGHPCTR